MTEGLESLLGRLGLTEYESRVLNALFRQGEAEAPEISIAAGVPKTRVYDVLERLKNKQVIIPISGRPKKYRVVDAKKVIEKLLLEKTLELEKLKAEAEHLKKSLSEKPDSSYSEKVIKVKDRRDFIKILGQEIDSAKECINGFSIINEGEAGHLNEALMKAGERKVNVMLIPHKDVKEKGIFDELQSKGAAIKGYEHGINAYVLDKKKVILAISNLAEERPEYHFTIWRDNPEMVALINSYFDQVWKKAR
jgi:sugar-specific transcriptional regulator TrmB